MASLDCDAVMRQLWEYLDGELSSERALALAAHLSECQRCHPRMAFELAFLAALGASRRTAGPAGTLRQRIVAALDAEGLLPVPAVHRPHPWSDPMNTASTTLPQLSLETAPADARSILELARQQVGMLPNMYGYMVHIPGLLETYLLGYERFRKESGFTPAEQEVVFLAVSRENACHYCMAAHSFLADVQSKVAPAVTDAIRNDAAIPDPRLATLAEFTRIMVRTRGRPDNADVDAFRAAGYSDRQVLAVILAIAVKTISNYTNHFAETPVDSMFQPRAWHPPVKA